MQANLKHVHQRIKTLMPYQPGDTVAKIKRIHHLDDVIKLASNENPLGASPKAIAAVQQNLPEIASYPEDQAPELKQCLCDLHDIQADQITFGCGSSEIFDLIIQLCMSSGGNLITSEHAFCIYSILAQAIGAQVISVADQNWQQDLSAMLAAITDETRLIVFANPNNPTGTWLPYTELQEFIQQVPNHITIVVDEAYCEYMTIPEYQTVVPLIDKYPNLIITRTFSKLYGLAGLRIGYSVSSPETTDLLNRLRKAFNVTGISLAAATAALQDESFIAQSLQVNKKGMQQLAEAFTTLQLPIIAQTGNFLTVDFGNKAHEIATQLLHQGIIVRPLGPYNMPHHLRISIGTEQQNKVLLDKLRLSFADLIGESRNN